MAHKDKLQKIWNQVEQTVSEVDKPYDLQGMRQLHDALIDVYYKYNTVSHVFNEFLRRANTQESLLEMESQLSIQKAHKMVVDGALSRLKTPPRRSGNRHSSNHSGDSKRSSVIARKRAEVEAAKAKMKYAEQEAMILKQQALLEEQQDVSNANITRQRADLKADLGLIAQQKEAAGAKAELAALELEESEGSQRDLQLAEYNVVQKNQIKETQNGIEQMADKQEPTHIPQPHKFPNFKPTPRGPLLSAFIKNDNHEPPGFTVQQPHLNVKATPFTPLKLEMEDRTVNNSAFADFLTREDVNKGTSSQHIIPDFPLENTDTDKEIRPLVSVSKTNVNDITKLGSNRFERFSSWMALVRAIARLKHFLSSVYSGTFHGWHSCVDCKSVHSFEEAQKFIIRVVQREVYDRLYKFCNGKSARSRGSLFQISDCINDTQDFWTFVTEGLVCVLCCKLLNKTPLEEIPNHDGDITESLKHISGQIGMILQAINKESFNTVIEDLDETIPNSVQGE
ncbi:unnamed protein product [Mytilus coruscus]|uniref:Uncharacterized protein n=1 Tax=Mytilus coruscus TaxID=42192 RepID=A0A6J8CXI1_MYTCO|nr:unnamed protein product [Mytilus coruscus]